MSVLVTCDPDFEGVAAIEIRRAAPEPDMVWIGDGVARVNRVGSLEDFSERLDATESVFVRHLAPCGIEIAAHAASIADAVRTASGSIPKDEPFSTHVRFVGGAQADPGMRRLLEQASEQASPGRFDRRQPCSVVSAVITPKTAYVGVADVRHCRSSWPGGERRYQRSGDMISRAEFKLLEALETFDLSLPPAGRALDLGAAPGGWTRVLLSHGLEVTAVDPAKLDPRLQRSDITSVQATAEEYLPSAPVCDAIVADIRTDPDRATAILTGYAARLKPLGFAVATLKLPRAGVRSSEIVAITVRCLDGLRTAYESVRARQLFHNRSEFTVALRGPRDRADAAALPAAAQ